MLAFDEGDNISSHSKRRKKIDFLAGDVIVSTDAAIKNSRIYATTLSRELALYVIHGILHLMGYDDHKTQDVKEMRKKEQEILAYLGVKAEKIVDQS